MTSYRVMEFKNGFKISPEDNRFLGTWNPRVVQVSGNLVMLWGVFYLSSQRILSENRVCLDKYNIF